MSQPLFTSQPRVRKPGLNVLPTNIERYLVKGGGSTALSLAAGDELELVNPEGLQPGEISVFDSNGRSDSGLIGARHDGNSEGLKQITARA
jgi:aminomethyltransferase